MASILLLSPGLGLLWLTLSSLPAGVRIGLSILQCSPPSIVYGVAIAAKAGGDTSLARLVCTAAMTAVRLVRIHFRFGPWNRRLGSRQFIFAGCPV